MLIKPLGLRINSNNYSKCKILINEEYLYEFGWGGLSFSSQPHHRIYSLNNHLYSGTFCRSSKSKLCFSRSRIKNYQYRY